MNSAAIQKSVFLEDDDEGVFQTHTGITSSRESPNKVQMSVPNPKRTVPVNFLSLPDEDSYSPFLDEPLEPVPNSSLSHKSSLVKPSTTATPEIFEFSTEAQQQHSSSLSVRTNGSAASNSDPSGSSRGVIGSARKSKSSNSMGPGGEGDSALGGWSNSLPGPILSRTTSPLGPVGGAIRPASTSPAPTASTSRLHLLGSSTDRQVQLGLENGATENSSLPSSLPTAWDSVQLQQQRQIQHMPICRPSSTPVYPTAITSLFKTDFDLGFDDGNDMHNNGISNNGHDVRGAGGTHFSDLLRNCDAPPALSGTTDHGVPTSQQQQQQQQGPVRGRDRDYSFGSLLGFNDLTSKLNLRGSNNTTNNELGTGLQQQQQQQQQQGRRVAFDDNGLSALNLADNLLTNQGVSARLMQSSSSLGHGSGSFFDFHSGGDVSGSNSIGHGGLTQRESLRAGLGALGGTVSAPPQFLTNLYATDGFGYDGSGITSASSASVGRSLNTSSATTTTYASVIGGHQDHSSSGSPHPIAPTSRTHSPVPQIGFGLISTTSQQQKQMRQSPVPGQPSTENKAAGDAGSMVDSSVEGAVLRSCREILAGAADRSLKAVELANTLRARVGTESLARVREQWGGLLSLLEKHGAHFRVDRIPKNDKVTLISNDGDEDDDAAVFGDGGGFGARLGGLRGGNASGGSRAHGSSAHSGESGGWSASSGTSAAGATRCLHVGNVPANMSEVQLMREFEKFGQLDGLKLVSQRNGTRRFAFITFHSIEQAITARHCLSKVHPWKSAISFAHKEFTQHGGGNGGGVSSGGPSAPGHLPLHHHQQHHHQQQQQQLQHQIMMMRNAQLGMAAGSPYGAPPDYQQSQQLGGNLLYQMQNNHQMMMTHQQPSMNMVPSYPYMGAPYGGVLGGGQPQPPQHQASPYWMQQQQVHHLPLPPFANPGDSFLPLSIGTGSAPALHNFTASAQPLQAPLAEQQQQQLHTQSFPQPGADVDCPVLRRLCDDTYVPTQPWPVDAARDQPYCLAVIAQLQHFDGYTTISKLRGFLRNRVAAVDNIKSVPLKAMLVAYPQYFNLVSNYVHLVNTNLPTVGHGVAPAV